MKRLLKKILRPPYAFVRYVILRYVKNHYWKSAEVFLPNAKLTKVSRLPVSYYGYYNVSPENCNGEIVYCSPSQKKGFADVYLNAAGQEVKIGDTAAFNWQQACMPLWGYSKDLIYYNVFDEEAMQYRCRVYSPSKRQDVGCFPMPVYSLSKQEDYALSLNFDRLAVMRPDYGYFCRKGQSLPDNEHDGIWKIDLATKETKLIISLQQLIDLKPAESMDGAMHKVNHIDISPDGNRFMFLHRWVGPKGRFMRLITADRDGKNLFILNGDKMTSHSYWVDSSRIVSFCHTNKYGNGYVVFEDLTENVSWLSDKLPREDGHPSTIQNGRWMVTDTYPSHDGMSKLYLYNLESGELQCLGRFYQPLKYKGPGRIDLHPKWNMTENAIYFESGHDGMRNLYCIDLSNTYIVK